MEQFTHALIIIAIIAAVFFAGYKIFLNPVGGSGSRNADAGSEDSKEERAPEPVEKKESATPTPDRKKDTGTVMFTEWSVCELDRGNGKPIHTSGIRIVPGGCFTIGRSDDCDFTLVQADVQEPVVGRYHLRVGVDEQGYFAKDNGSVNGTFINDIEVRASFSLQDGQVVWLADCPIVFIRHSMDRNISRAVEQFSVDSANATRSFSRQDAEESVQDAGFHR